MAVTIKQTEGAPESYPDSPAGLSTGAAALDAALLWQRIEAYVALRTTERDVSWVVEGCGEWQPPLTPATIATTEVWQSDAWQAIDLAPSPIGGYMLPGDGPYRFTGTAGNNDADVPAMVLEAFRRLAEYTAEIQFEYIGVRSVNVPDVASEELAPPSFRAMALQNSGAADLLRNYRRA